MQTQNEHGVYEPERTEELARIGRSYAAARSCQCDDGLYRYALDVSYSYGGFCGPISTHGEGFPDYAAAKNSAIKELLAKFPKGFPTDLEHVRNELAALKAMVTDTFRQPTLF